MKNNFQTHIDSMSSVQRDISQRLTSLEKRREDDSDQVSKHYNEIAKRLDKIDDYIDREHNFREFREEQKKNVQRNMALLVGLFTVIVALTGWGFFEKGLYTPIPPRPIISNARS